MDEIIKTQETMGNAAEKADIAVPEVQPDHKDQTKIDTTDFMANVKAGAATALAQAVGQIAVGVAIAALGLAGKGLWSLTKKGCKKLKEKHQAKKEAKAAASEEPGDENADIVND